MIITLSHTRRQHIARALSLLVPLSVAIVLVMLHLGDGDSNIDAQYSRLAFSRNWPALWPRFFNNPVTIYGGYYPPLYFFALRGYGLLFGSDTLRLRLFSAIVFLVVIVFSWRVFPYLTKSASARDRAIFTGLLAINPVLIWWGQTEKYTLLFHLWCILATVCAIWFMRNPRWLNAALLGLCLALAFYTHYLGIIVAGATFTLIGARIVIQKKPRVFIKLALAGLVFILVTAPIVPNFIGAIRERARNNLAGGAGAGLIAADTLWRGLLMTSFFGPTLNYQTMPASDSADRLGSVINRYGIVVFASLVLAASAAFSLVTARRAGLLMEALFVIGLPALILMLIFAVRVVFIFDYMGAFFAWIFSVTLAIGWSLTANRSAKYVQITVIALLCMVSLGNYFPNITNKYPSAGVVAGYLNTLADGQANALVDSAIYNTAFMNGDGRVRAPIVISSFKTDADLGARLMGTGYDAIGFFSGSSLMITKRLTRYGATNPALNWRIIKSFIALDGPENSVQVVQFTRSQ